MDSRRADPDALDKPLLRLALVLVLGAIAPLLDTTIAGIALHTLAGEFGADVAAIQWVSTAYLLALAVAVPASGWATERFGDRSVWIGALVMFTAGSAVSGLAWDLGSLIAFRVVQGLAAGIIQPVVLTMLARAAGPRRLGRVLTIVTLVGVVVPIAGPVIGGLVLACAGWRWLFLCNVPLCVIAAAAAAMVAPRSPTRTAAHLDVPGLLLLAPALVGVLYGLSRTSAGAGLTDVDTVVPLSVGLVLLAGYTVRSIRSPESALVDLRLFRIRSFGAAAGVMFFSGLSLYAAMFLLPLFYQQVRGRDALAAGLLLAPQGIGSLLARPVGRIVDRIGARRITIVGILVCALATLPFTAAGAGGEPLVLSCALVARGAGLSAVNIAVMASAFRDVPRASLPHASTITRVLQQVGGSFGTAILAAVIVTGASTVVGAFETAFAWSVALTGLALAPALLMRQ